MKFALRNYAGQPKKFFIVEERTLPPITLSAEVGHHILVVDRSGSMYYSMTELRSMVEKVLTIEEFANAGQLVSLLSYSSQGDLTVHFERTPVADILAPGSRHVESIRRLQATAMTCVSQALEYATKLLRPTETTGISVHTDGYFNDRSPTLEVRAIDRWIEQMRPAKNVFVNTIAYGGWCDYVLLDRIANALSGKMVRASTAKDVYTALHDTSKLLAGRTVPAVTLDSDGSWQVAYAPQARKVNGTTLDLTLRGLGAGETPEVWRYREVTEAVFNKSKEPENDDLRPIYAFARTALAAGRLNDAKYAFVTTRDGRLPIYAKAITPTQLAEFAEALDGALYGKPGPDVYTASGAGYGLSGGKPSIPQLCAVLDHHKANWTLDLTTFLAGYQKRGLKRLQGTWVTDEATGKDTFVPANFRLVSTEDPTCLSVSGFEYNNSTATINMLVTQKAELRDREDRRVPMVAGKKLDLRQHNNYTLVGDGAVNAKVLPIFVATESLWRALVSLGVADGPFKAGQSHLIDLTELPVLAYDLDLAPPKNVFIDLAACKIVLSFLSAALPAGGEAALAWTDEQKAELDAHCLTAKLNFSPPTTVPYRDPAVAIAQGLVDLRTSYKVEFLGTEVAGLGELYSANAFVQRHFTVTRDGKALEKFTVADALADGNVVTYTPAKKLNAVDTLMLPYLHDFFRRSGQPGTDHTAISALLKAAGSEQKWLADYRPEKLLAVQKLIEAYQEELYAAEARPAAFYIGATGMLPDTWGTVPALDADAVKARLPNLGLTKKQKENGTFFILDRVQGQTMIVLAVYASNEMFSTPAGVAAAKALSTQDAE